jgi:hypothetical protein
MYRTLTAAGRVNTAVKLGVSRKAYTFLTLGATVSFSRRIVFQKID